MDACTSRSHARLPSRSLRYAMGLAFLCAQTGVATGSPGLVRCTGVGARRDKGGDCSQYVSLPLFSLLRSFQRHTISENKHQLERNPPFGMVITKGSLNIMTLHHPHLLCVVPRGYRNLTSIFVCVEFRSYKTTFQDSCARVVARYAEFASQSYFVPVSFFSHKSCFSLTIHPMHEFHFSNSRNLPFIFF